MLGFFFPDLIELFSQECVRLATRAVFVITLLMAVHCTPLRKYSSVMPLSVRVSNVSHCEQKFAQRILFDLRQVSNDLFMAIPSLRWPQNANNVAIQRQKSLSYGRYWNARTAVASPGNLFLNV
jgi:hypothetical protein